MQKSALQYGEIIFQSKVIPLFLPKCFQAPFILYMVYCILYGSDCRFFTLYGSDCREEEKKGKTWRNEVDTKTVKIATSEIHISILKRNFTIL